jgi:hypothetical protein
MYWDKALHAYEFILVFSAVIHLVRVVQEFDFGLVRNGDPRKFTKLKKTVEEAYVLTASIQGVTGGTDQTSGGCSLC